MTTHVAAWQRPPPARAMVTCAWCWKRVPRATVWRIPADGAEHYCRAHFSTDDARLYREGETK